MNSENNIAKPLSLKHKAYSVLKKYGPIFYSIFGPTIIGFTIHEIFSEYIEAPYLIIIAILIAISIAFIFIGVRTLLWNKRVREDEVTSPQTAYLALGNNQVGKYVAWGVVLIAVPVCILLAANGALKQLRIINDQRSMQELVPDIIRSMSQVKMDQPEGNLFTGKVLPIDIRKKEIDELYAYLPDKLRATSPNQVRTYLVVDWESVVVGRYQSGAAALTHNCKILIIDKETLKLLDTKYFNGGSPPSTKKGYGSASGAEPFEEILRYLEHYQTKE